MIEITESEEISILSERKKTRDIRFSCYNFLSSFANLVEKTVSLEIEKEGEIMENNSPTSSSSARKGKGAKKELLFKILVIGDLGNKNWK